jgi:hypothetical protein
MLVRFNHVARLIANADHSGFRFVSIRRLVDVSPFCESTTPLAVRVLALVRFALDSNGNLERVIAFDETGRTL